MSEREPTLRDVMARLDGIDGRLDGIYGRLDGIDGRLDGRLDGIDGRLDQVRPHGSRAANGAAGGGSDSGRHREDP